MGSIGERILASPVPGSQLGRTTELMTATNPLRGELFLKSLRRDHIGGWSGSYIHNQAIANYSAKFDPFDGSGYASWMRAISNNLLFRTSTPRPKIIDVGCGTGEFTILLRYFGCDAFGVDLDPSALKMAQNLASENGFPSDIFLNTASNQKLLPFEDKSFHGALLISALEHMDDVTARALFRELSRVCCAAVYLQLPSRASISDDHTGLKFVPWMPRWLAVLYLALRGDQYKYKASVSGEWDVHYRSLNAVYKLASEYFKVSQSPLECSFPRFAPLEGLWIHKQVYLFGRRIHLRVPLIWRILAVSIGRDPSHYRPSLLSKTALTLS